MISKNKRGFASLDVNARKSVASKGGKAAHAQGRAHVLTPEEARIGGAKGGHAVARKKGHMAEIGRRGGLARHRRSVEEAC
jgi:general stress protein YciG